MEPVVLAVVGGLVDKVVFTLALYGENMDPEEVTRALGLQPTEAHRRGERRRPTSVPYKTGAWLLSAESESPVEPEIVASTLLARLPRDDGLWLALSAAYDIRFTLGIFTTGWNRGFDLSNSTMRRISELGASVGFDLYADPESSEQD